MLDTQETDPRKKAKYKVGKFWLRAVRLNIEKVAITIKTIKPHIKYMLFSV